MIPATSSSSSTVTSIELGPSTASPPASASPTNSPGPAAAVAAAHAPLNDLDTAPRIRYASPYSDILHDVTHKLLHQIHSELELRITNQAMILLHRIQDRCAHYLLALRHYGVESEWASKNRLEYATPSQLPQNDELGSLLDFRFPSWIQSAASNLIRHGVNERKKSLIRFHQNGEYPSTYLTFVRECAERWCQDFRMGANQAESEDGTTTSAASSSSLFNEADHVALSTYLEYLTAELLELSGNETIANGREEMCGIDLWKMIVNDPEIMPLIRFLPIEWKYNQEEVHPSLGVESGLIATFEIGIIRILEFDWQTRLKQITCEAAPCWFDGATLVTSVAHKFARGQFSESAITATLRKCHTRPYRYWGGQSESHFRSIHPSEGYSTPEGGYSYVSFLLEDGAGQEWHIMIEYQKGSSSSTHSGRMLLLEGDWKFCSFTSRLKEKRGKLQLELTKKNDWPIKLTNGSVYQPHTIVVDQTSESILSTPPQQTETTITNTAEITPVEVHFTNLFSQLLPHLIDYEKFGPSFYVANQPVTIRRQFTAALIDECMTASGFTFLPDVLVSLIADYHTFDLPFLTQERKWQVMNQ